MDFIFSIPQSQLFTFNGGTATIPLTVNTPGVYITEINDTIENGIYIRLGYKDSAWFTANPNFVLKSGEHVYNSDNGEYKIGDGVTILSLLPFYGSSSATGGLSQSLSINNNAGSYNIDMNNNLITNLSNPVSNGDAVNLSYLENTVDNYLPLSGGTMQGSIRYPQGTGADFYDASGTIIKSGITFNGSTTYFLQLAATQTLRTDFNTIQFGTGDGQGAKYIADYSAGFVNESLITKRYLTNYVATASSNISAGNGLSVDSSVVKLGGTISQNTNVAGAGNELYFGTSGSPLYTFGINSDFFNVYGNSGVNLSGAFINLTGLSDLLLVTPNKSIRLYETNISVPNNGTNNGLIVYDDVTNKGLVYFADYSSNFTPESLITKRYVTNYVATASSVPNLSQVLLVGSSSGTQSINMNNNKIVNLATASSILDAVNYIQLDNSVRSDFGCGVDGDSGTVASGFVGYKTMPCSGVITGWDLIGSPTGSIVFDIWKTSANTIPTVSDSIIVSGGPTISNNVYAGSNSLGGWTSLTFSTGDKFGFNIATASSFTMINLSLKTKKTY
jgi:hypothetical protein